MKRSKRSKRRLELELRKTRKEADAARLEAKAAELQLRLDRYDSDTGTSSDSGLHGSPSVPAEDASSPHSRRVQGVAHWRSWSDVRRAMQDGNATLSGADSIAARSATTSVLHRLDSSHETRAPRHSRFDLREESTALSKESSLSESPTPRADLVRDLPTQDVAKPFEPEEQIPVFGEPDEATEQSKRRRPAALIVSSLAHGLLLLGLACFTLSSHRPGDQVAIAGSVEDTDEVAIESIEIEAAEMEVQESEPTPTTTADYEVSDVGEIFAPEIDSDALETAPLVENMLSTSSTQAAAQSLLSDSQATTQFCGVQGGGNHFVYLVDSSGSMGDAFESARQELLRSIDALNPKQRFYVIFFDSEPDYMRLSSPNADEPRSASATPENKQALARWAMTIQMDRGKAPYDAIPFALKLRPDAIFLLSDGEFPQRIEDLLRETNRVDNLFGDDGPISIVHTIGYHSREGENRMKRIAKQNGGQYRHVPKP